MLSDFVKKDHTKKWWRKRAAHWREQWVTLHRESTAKALVLQGQLDEARASVEVAQRAFDRIARLELPIASSVARDALMAMRPERLRPEAWEDQKIT